MKRTPFIIGLLFISTALFAQSENVSLQVVTPQGLMKEYSFKLPFGPPSIGDSTSVIKKINTILSENEIDCPPKREKISENIWKCGNGKLIRTNDARLGRILAKAWD